MKRVVVVGGGIAGLAAAHRLRECDPTIAVDLIEAAPRLGGTITTEHTDGFTIEGGADSFITEKPWAMALCDRMGIAADIIGTREGERRTWVVRDGRPCPLPEGFLMLAPTSLLPLVASPLFSWTGKARMALDLVLPRRREPRDESLADFVRRRLGREALERAADPLVSGIYTADPERLSLGATMPRFAEMEATHRSLILGLRAAGRATATRDAAGARYALFAAHRDGMGGLIDAIARRLPAETLRVGTRVEGLVRSAGGWTVRAGGDAIQADAVIVAVPAYDAATVLRDVDPTLAERLGAIEYASSATVTFGFRSTDVGDRLRGFGFVVPAVEHRDVIAATFASRKYAGRAPEGFDLVRAFVGGARRPEMVEVPDAALVDRVRGELRGILGITAAPLFTRVHRYVRKMPQYHVGHLDRVTDLERRVAALPGLELAGAAYRGVGIPDCIRSGEAAAERVLAWGS